MFSAGYSNFILQLFPFYMQLFTESFIK